ncbi:MAG: AraC family transcriptional regulator [Candidatus Competibacter denitrificans]
MTQHQPHQGMPELEISDKQPGAIRYLEHGCPHWRIRWHYHDEYELHLIVASSGKMFIGDYIGVFQPGCLVLTGPRVPHNWVTDTTDQTKYALRDRVVHFDHEVVIGAVALFPELSMLLPLLDRAKYGVEFLRHAETAEKYIVKMKEADGAARVGYFCELLDLLAHSPYQQVLSTTQLNLPINSEFQRKVDLVIHFVMGHYPQKIALAQVAALVNMSEGHFSRFFHRATGSSFSDFVNRVRIARACDLLSRTDRAITLIAGEIGFNNIANFNRRFTQHKQMTPSKYRQQARERYYLAATPSSF